MVLHLIQPGAWRAALDDGAVRPPSLEAVGFVHLSTPEQVHLPTSALFPGRRDLALLVVDPARLPDPVPLAVHLGAGAPVPGDNRVEVVAPAEVHDLWDRSWRRDLDVPPDRLDAVVGQLIRRERLDDLVGRGDRSRGAGGGPGPSLPRGCRWTAPRPRSTR